MVLLAAGIAMKKNMHVGVDILLRVLPKKFQKIIIVFSFIFHILFFNVSTKRMFCSYIIPALIPMWIPYLSVPIGIIYITLELVIVTISKYKERNS